MRVITVFPTMQGYEDEADTFAELARLVDEHHVITKPWIESIARRLSEYAGNRLKWHFIDSRGIRFFAEALRLVATLAGRNSAQPTVVHEHFVGYSCLLPWLTPARRCIRRVLSLYAADSLFVTERRWRSRSDKVVGIPMRLLVANIRLSVVRTLLQAISTLGAHGVHAVSQEVLRQPPWLFRWPKRVLVLPSPISLERWSAVPGAERSVNDILFVGRLEVWKGINVVLEVARVLRERFPEIRLTMVGSGHAEEVRAINEAIRRASLERWVHLLGPVGREDVRRLYSQSNVLVFPSWHEGSPRVVREALACGCAVVAADIPGNRFGGHYRLLSLVDSFNPRDWSAAVSTFLRQSPTERLEAASQDRLELSAHFAPKVVAHRLVDFYQTLWD